MINSIRETYQDFCLFLKRPVDQPDPIQSSRHKIKRLFSLLIIEIPIVAVIGAFIYGIEKLGLINTEEHKLELLFQQLPLWRFMLLVIIIGPFAEEIIFRLYLRFKNNDLIHFIIKLVSFMGRENGNRMESYLNHLWTNKFRRIFLFSAVMFAYFHLTSYELTGAVLLLSPILIAPQFVVGLIVGYLRVKHNLMLGYCMHVIHNAFFILVSLILMG